MGRLPERWRATVGIRFYLGPKDTGAQPHIHAHAWNMMAYGRKLWHMWNPSQAFYTTMPIRPYLDAVITKLPAEEQPITCVQEAGDFVYGAHRSWLALRFCL